MHVIARLWTDVDPAMRPRLPGSGSSPLASVKLERFPVWASRAGSYHVVVRPVVADVRVTDGQERRFIDHRQPDGGEEKKLSPKAGAREGRPGRAGPEPAYTVCRSSACSRWRLAGRRPPAETSAHR